MVTKKNLLVVVLMTFCLASVLFFTVRTYSSSDGYDPLADYNEDGTINMRDIAYLVGIFNQHGEPLNRTALLDQQSQIEDMNVRLDNLNSSLNDLRLEVESMNATNLMPLLDSLNTSLIGLRSDIVNMNNTLSLEISMLNVNVTDLQFKLDTLNSTLSSRISTLETQVATINATITAMSTTIAQLQASNATLYAIIDSQQSTIDSLGSSLTALMNRIDLLEANSSVTNLRLAPYAIPFNVTYSNQHNWTTETSGFVDMPYTSVTLSLNRTSQLLIMFSANAWVSSATSNPVTYIKCQAVVNGTAATPNVIQLTPTMTTELGNPVTHAHRIYNCTCSFNFYTDTLSAGIYTIQIRWYLSATGQGDVGSRTLEVIALPV